MKTPTAALQTAAVTTLAVASGVTALWLTLGALDSSSAPQSQPAPDVQIQYVDQAGNPIGNDGLAPTNVDGERPVLVVDEFGEPYVPDQTTPDNSLEVLPVEPQAMESAYSDPTLQPGEPEYDEDEDGEDEDDD